MKPTLIIALLFSSLSPLHASDAFLEPPEGYFSSYDFAHEYRSQVRRILLKDATDKPLARMVILPAFRPEAAISLEEKANQYVIVQRLASVAIWDNKNPRQIKTAVKEITLDKETALLIHEVFFLATNQTRYSPDKSHMTDRTSFYFSSFRMGEGLRGGLARSPDDKSPMGALVAYGRLVTTYLNAKPEERDAIKTRLRSEGRTLISHLNKNL